MLENPAVIRDILVGGSSIGLALPAAAGASDYTSKELQLQLSEANDQLQKIAKQRATLLYLPPEVETHITEQTLSDLEAAGLRDIKVVASSARTGEHLMCSPS